MIANLLTALLGQRSSRRYVGRHRVPEPPTLTDDGIDPSRTDVIADMITNDGAQTMVMPPTASR